MQLEQLTKIFTLISQENNWQFSLKGRTLTDDEVFSFNGMLPAAAKRADQLSMLCLGYGLGVGFEESENCILGYQMSLSGTGSDIVCLAMILDVFSDIVKHSPTNLVALDELLYE